MEIDRELADSIYRVTDQYTDKEHDWPAIEQALRCQTGLDFEKSLAVLVGLRALEQLKDSPSRLKRIKAARALAQWQKGWQAKSSTRRKLRSLAIRRYDRLQSLLLLGFMVDQGSERVSRPIVRALSDALAFVIHVPRPKRSADRLAKSTDELLYQRIRQRVHRGRSSIDRAEARAFFQTVYAMVFD